MFNALFYALLIKSRLCKKKKIHVTIKLLLYPSANPTCRRVLTTSSGDVHTAPTSPPTLSNVHMRKYMVVV